MKIILENWKKYTKKVLLEQENEKKISGSEKKSAEKKFAKLTIEHRDALIEYIHENPEVNENIFLDRPRGTFKKFGGERSMQLPFDYGEWPNLINPADNMGWDLIIVPSATKDSSMLLPVGFVEYKNEDLDRIGNDKIILAPNKNYKNKDKEVINVFFEKLDQFNPVQWL